MRQNDVALILFRLLLYESFENYVRHSRGAADIAFGNRLFFALLLNKILLLLVGECHEHDGEQASHHEENECPVPTSVFGNVADNDVGKHGCAEHIAHEACESGSCSSSILWSQIESLNADEHHRTIDEESDGDEATDDNVEVVEELPVDGDGDDEQAHEDDGWESTTAVEHFVAYPTADDGARNGGNLIGEVSPTGFFEVNAFFGEDSRSPVEAALAHHANEGTRQRDVPQQPAAT